MKNKLTIIFAFASFLFVLACNSTDLSFTLDQAIGFSESTMHVQASDSDEIEISLALNAALTTDGSIKINVLGVNGFVYGVDYTTEPAATEGQIELALVAGATKGIIKYLGITKAVTDSKSVLFQLESGINISLGQASTQEFSLVLTALEPITISNNFEDCTEEFSIPSGFSEITIAGFKTDRGWGCRSNGVNDSRAVRASAFGGEEGEDNAWLIMDAVNLSGYSLVTLSFDVNSLFSGPGQIIVQWSSNYNGTGDPAMATWNVLTDVNNAFPADGSSTWTNIVSDPITGITGAEFYLAFQYVGGTSASSSSWDIDNLILTGN